MKVISLISKHSGCGQTTIAVNLASGLIRKGYRVLIIDPGQNEKLHNWLGMNPKQDRATNVHTPNNNSDSTILSSRMGIDLLSSGYRHGCCSDEQAYFSILEKLEYDYLLVQPESNRDCQLLSSIADTVIVCTDLSHENELEELQVLEQCLQHSAGKATCINLILPNKINTKEWEHNSQQLFALADYFGFEKIADPIPYCERIHDLPLEGHTVWELSQQNLQAAFMRLVEAVEKF